MAQAPRRPAWTRTTLALAAVVVAGAAWGWTHGPAPDGVARADPVSEVGNARPVVRRYGGRMVHRCTAVTVSLQGGADGAAVQAALHAAGDRAGLPLVDLPPGVLPAAYLDVTVPDLVACLPQGATADDAARLLPDPLPGEDRRSVQAVLVHDLAFTVRPAGTSAQEAADAVDREGILADVLGRYAIDAGAATDTATDGQLRVRYTGQLLGDDEVDTVRTALARAAGVPESAVSTQPADPSAPGVDLRDEPVTSPAPDSPGTQHSH